MKWTKQEIAGMLISKDLVDPLEYTINKLLGASSPDKRYYGAGSLGDLAWYWATEPSTVLGKIESNLTTTQLKNAGKKIMERLEGLQWTRYTMPTDKFDDKYHGIQFIRVYRARRIKTIKVLSKKEGDILLGEFTSDTEFDIFKMIQWLEDWSEETSVYETIYDNIMIYARALVKYEDKDKLFNMHFGDEYTASKKKSFENKLVELINYLDKEKPDAIVVSMDKQRMKDIFIEANI
jgi:hypothetical protein